MPKHDVDALYRRIDAANKRHLREFDRYTRMLTSGFRSGRFYSEQELAAQLAKADEAMAEGQAAEAAFHEAMNGEGPADN